MNKRKLLKKAINSPNNFRFSDFVALLEAFGYTLDRTEGSHRMFRHPAVGQKVNVQEDNGQAKAYQVRQFLKLVEKYNLKLEDDKEEKE